ncbi:MAG: helix-turn-helix domain-containing protein [Bdellovibrionales bacterium]|nr:helix-turn-helix domain-containing protein [Bdellovibrionales bacterium]
MNDNENSEYMTEGQVARRIGIKQRTLQAWRLKGDGPKAVRLSERMIRYKKSEVDRWLVEVEAKNSGS